MFSDYRNLVDFIGVCPQEDVLIDRMTVSENLMFFCKFKNTENADQVIQETLDKFNLYEKHDTQEMSLSGGQKRKLLLASNVARLVCQSPVPEEAPSQKRPSS